MSILTVADLKAHLNITLDTDDAIVTDKIAAAEAWVSSFIGADLVEDFPDGVPDPIKEAIRQLTGHLYENREASLVGTTAEALPFGVTDLLAPYRAWCF